MATLLVAWAPFCAAQTDACTATVKIVPLGVQHPDPTRMPNRTITSYRYMIEATASDKQCAIVSFKIQRSYTLPDGKPFTATEPASIRIRGGKGSESGELPEKRGISKIYWTAEDISCRRCPQ